MTAAFGSTVSSKEYEWAKNVYSGPQFSGGWHLWVRLRPPNIYAPDPQLVCDQPDVVAKAQLMHYLLIAHLIISDLGKLAMEYLGPVFDLVFRNDMDNIVVLSNIAPLITSPLPVKVKIAVGNRLLVSQKFEWEVYHPFQRRVVVNGFSYGLPKNDFQFFLSIGGEELGSHIYEYGVIGIAPLPEEELNPDFPLMIELSKHSSTKLNPSMFL